MKAKFALLIIALLLILLCVGNCGCGRKKSKAAEMNRVADSTYRADSAKVYAP